MNEQNKLLPHNVDVMVEGRTIMLKPITENEINQRYLFWLNDPETNRFLEIRYRKQTIAGIYDYINGLRSSKGCEIFAVFSKKNNTHIGNVAITHFNVNNHGTAIYGAMIGDPRARLLGLGAEAEALIVEFLFSNPEIRKVRAGAYEENIKSWQLLESLGFKREGVLRKEAVMVSSKICDSYLYGMLREEWLAQKPRLARLLRDIKIIDKRKKTHAIKN